VTDTTDDKSSDPGSQADELTEMWDASALEAAAAGFEPPVEAPKPAATAPAKRDEPTIQVNAAAISAPPPKRKRKKKRGLAALGLPMQLALAVFVAVGTFGLVRLLLAH
jgi:hypothetical protein